MMAKETLLKFLQEKKQITMTDIATFLIGFILGYIGYQLIKKPRK